MIVHGFDMYRAFISAPWDLEREQGQKSLPENVLAAECRDEAAMPLREAIVCLKDAPRETDPGILAFRKELEELQGVRVFHFDKPESLKTQLLEVCGGWVRSIVEACGGATGRESRA